MRNIVQEDADEIMEETNFDVETDEDDDDMVGVWLLSYFKKLSKQISAELVFPFQRIFIINKHYDRQTIDIMYLNIRITSALVEGVAGRVGGL